MAHTQGKSPFDNKPSSSSLAFEEFVPPSAWTEDSTCHYLLVDLPGFKRQELKLQVDDRTHLLVSGETQVRENKFKRFEQRFELPKNADVEKISGKLDAEILYISVPKKVEHEHQEIKHDNIPIPAPAPAPAPAPVPTRISDNIYGEEDDEYKSNAGVNEDESGNKVGEKDLERKKHRTRFDKNREQETNIFMRRAMQKLKHNKGIVVTAIFAFALGVLVNQKFQSNGN